MKKKLVKEGISEFQRFFCISCEDQAFGRMKFPMTGQAFGFSNSRIGYWNLEMKGFDWVPGDWRRSRRTDCFLD
ncbi:unnamed protein product [Rhizophagus irregularis]|nr:unnamed protein product [Rhizophagus irregularis]